jgi:hypothetical protein
LRLRLGQHERCALVPNDYAAVANFVETNARARKAAKTSAGGKAEVRA